ncbi:MAG: tRNA pseudouridine(38-40) synthase TruA [Selenomonadaceae bacterium]
MKSEHKELMKQRKRNIKLTISYDGGRYHGFQRQRNVTAVQNVLEDKLGIIFGDSIEMAASGRTDAGVHAYGQVVNFFTDGMIPLNRVLCAANSLLPEDIRVVKAEEADRDFSARHSAKSKIYIYKIQQGAVLDPFSRQYSWHIRNRLDLEAMRTALKYIEGQHDFSSFQAAGSVPMLPVRTLYEASVKQEGNRIEFRFWGNGFLYHMARNLVGTLVNVGRGKITPFEFREILEARDRHRAGATAPAQGLYLLQVNY